MMVIVSSSVIDVTLNIVIARYIDIFTTQRKKRRCVLSHCCRKVIRVIEISRHARSIR
jgi:hypothetical protein